MWPWHRRGSELRLEQTPQNVQVQTSAGLWFESRIRPYRTLEWSPEAINVVRDGLFVYVNPAAIQMYGASTAQELLGTPTRDRVHPDDYQLALGRLKLLTHQHVSAPLVEMRFLKQVGKADTAVEHRCTASIGVALFINNEASHVDILKWADTAMYLAKKTGRNLIRFHDGD